MTARDASPTAPSPAAPSHAARPVADVAKRARPLGLRFIVAVANEPWQEHDAARTAERWAVLCTEHGDPTLGNSPVRDAALRDAVTEVRTLFAIAEPQAAANALNAALASATATSELAQLADGRWAMRPALPYDARAATAYRMLAVAALADWFAERGRPAWGYCAAPGCGNVFIDEGRRQPQRFCTPTCATRTRVAAHRRGTAGE